MNDTKFFAIVIAAIGIFTIYIVKYDYDTVVTAKCKELNGEDIHTVSNLNISIMIKYIFTINTITYRLQRR